MILILAYSIKPQPEIFFEINEDVYCDDADVYDLSEQKEKDINDMKFSIAHKLYRQENLGIRTLEEHDALFKKYMDNFDDYFVYAVTTVMTALDALQ